MNATKLKARVVYDVGTAQFVGEVVDVDGNLIRAFFGNEWDHAMDAAKAYAADPRENGGAK